MRVTRNPIKKPMSGDANNAINTLPMPFHLMASSPTPIHTAPTNPPSSAWEELPGIPKYQVMRFHTIAPNNADMITVRVSTSDWTTWSAIVFATTTPNKKGPTNSEMEAMLNAVCGLNARDEIIVATTLLTSRIPFRKSKVNASMITIISSWDIVLVCHCEGGHPERSVTQSKDRPPWQS